MTKTRIALIAAVTIILLALGVILLAVKNLDSLVKQAIETAASAATGTDVHVADVTIDLRQGRGIVSGLTIANPVGFSEQPLLQLDAIEIRLNPASLTAAVPVIDEIRVGASTFHYEINQLGESNLRFVQKNAKRQAKATATTAQSSAASPSSEKRFRIRRLTFAESTATLDLGQFGSGQGTARIPGMTLTDLGGEQGATSRELAAEIVQVLGKKLADAVGGGALNRLGDSLGETFRKLRNR